jgi:hypothetical protein
LQSVNAQSIVIVTGASIYVPEGADICAGEYGNITGNLIGEGTQCGQTPLPVELQSFSAAIKNNMVILNWKTETEVSNYGFEIERSINNNWKKIGFAEGYGNSNSPKSYSFTDKNLVGGSKFQYRLKQVDTDGQFEYSNIVEVEFLPYKFALFQNYPNPFNPTTKIRYQLPKESKVVIKIYDILGSEIMTLINDKKEPGTYEVELNAQNLSSGTYIYRIVAGQFIETKKMVLMK